MSFGGCRRYRTGFCHRRGKRTRSGWNQRWGPVGNVGQGWRNIYVWLGRGGFIKKSGKRVATGWRRCDRDC